MTIILTDVDDCIVDFSDRFQRYVEGLGLPTQGRLREIWRIEQLLGIEPEAVIPLLHRFTGDPAITHDPEPCAREVLPDLHRAGYRFVAISACGTDPGYHARRLDNLQSAFGFAFEALHCVPFGASKQAVLAQYPSAIWVEDTLGHAHDGARAGHRTFLLDRPYNAGLAGTLATDPLDSDPPPHITRVATWRDVRAMLLPQTEADLVASAASHGVTLRMRRYGDDDPVLKIDWVENVFGRKGAGRQALAEVCAYADRHRIRIVGHAMDGEPALMALYQSLGWRVVDGGDDDGPLLSREPR